MLKVALTGNIGSGKSVVAKVFAVIGIPVFNADIEAKKLYDNSDVVTKLVELLSDDVLDDSGSVDLKKLASIIFTDKNALSKVNNLIHPMVIDAFDDFVSVHSDEQYVIHETAILFENNLQDKFDYIINVSANLDLRIVRVMTRDNQSHENVLKRVANQIDDSDKCTRSDFVIYNNEDDFIIPQVIKIHKQLCNKIV